MAFSRTTVVPQLLGQGMSAGETDPKLSGRPTFVKNGVFRREGSIDKRHGTSVANSSAGGDRLFSLLGVLYSFGQGVLYAQHIDDTNTAIDSNRIHLDVAATDYSSGTSERVAWSDAATCGSIAATVEIERVSISSYSTTIRTFISGTKTQLDSLVLFSGRPHASAFAKLFVKQTGANAEQIGVGYLDLGGSYPGVRLIDPTTGAIGSETLYSHAPAFSDWAWDVRALNISGGTSDEIVFAYVSANTDVTVATSSDYDTENGGSSYTNIARVSLCEWGDGYACVAYQDAPVSTAYQVTTYAARVAFSGGTSIGTPASAEATAADAVVNAGAVTCVAVSASNVDVIWSHDGLVADTYAKKTQIRRFSSAGTFPAAATTLSMVAHPAADAFYAQSKTLLPMAIGNSTERTLCIVDANSGGIEGTSLNEELLDVVDEFYTDAAVGTSYGVLPGTTESSRKSATGVYYMGATVESSFDGDTGSASVEIETDPPMPRVLELNGVAMFAGSVPRILSGERYDMYSPVNAPEIVSATAKGTGDALTSGITYKYQACYAYYDASGAILYGPMSRVYSVTPASTKDYDVEVLCHHVDQNQDSIDVLLFRSYEDTERSVLVASAQCSSTSATVTLTDSVNDSQIVAPGGFYTAAYTDGALSYAACPGHRVHGLSQGRYWAVPRSHESTRAWYSNTTRPGAQVSFYGGWIELPEHGGKVNGVVELLDKTLFLKESAIYAVDGQGPNALDEGQFVGPYLIDGTIGCSNPDSIAKFGLNIMFESLCGIYVITPGLELAPVGSDVKYYTDNATINTAITLPPTSEVVFFTSGAAMSDGEALVYSYRFNAWSVWDNHKCHSAAYTVNPNVSSADQPGSLYILDTDAGEIIRTLDGTYSDGGEWIELMVVGPWVARNQVGGYKRVLSAELLGQKVTDCTINMDIGYGYDDHFVEPHSRDLSDLENITWAGHLDGADAGATHARQAMLIKAWPKNTRCTACRVKIYDEMPDGGSPTQGVSISSISWEFQGVPGAFRNDGRGASYGG